MNSRFAGSRTPHKLPLSRKTSSLEPLEDRIAPATFTVITTADTGAGSLRQAIVSANATPAADTIIFNIAGSGPHTINLLSALPPITQPLTIDGSSEPDYNGARPAIVLNGSGAANAAGLIVESAAVTIRALTIHSFTNTGIFLDNGGGTVVRGCFIGTDPTGTVAMGNSAGGIIIESANNIIGGVNAADRNVIAGNLQSGITILGAGAIGNVIRGNYIGTNLLASLQIPNAGAGVSINTGGNNIVGGAAAGEGNVISGNGGDDVVISSSNENTIAGNIIGLDLTMKLELQSKGDGITIQGNSSNNLIGGTTAAARNVIAGHDEPGNGNGIAILGTGTGNRVLGNLIGTNPMGEDELENNNGIFVSAPGTIIGDLAGHGNLIAGNKTYGIYGLVATGLQLLGNRVGIYQVASDLTLANGSHGIYLDDVDNAVIRGNIAGGNNGDGLQLRNSANPIIQGNFLGTNAAGTLARANQLSGLAVINCTGVVVGGTGVGEGNVMSGNNIYGLYIFSDAPVSVFGNRIGTNLAAESPVGNLNSGIMVDGGTGHLIGGSGAGQGNIISGNGRGILVDTDGALIRGNIIGLDKDATTKIPNQGNGTGQGIHILTGSNTVIGGNLPGEGNIIAGNGGSAILIAGTGTGNKVVGNLIGTNSAGAAGLGNGAGSQFVHTVFVTAPGSIIGGPAAGDRNVIVSGSGRGIHISNAPDALVQGNWIGLAPNGNTPLANLAGIAFSGIGTTNATVIGNVISGNTTWGIGGTDNGGHVITANRIGTNAAGTAVVANGQQGILLNRIANVTIGGSTPSAGNVIAGSGIDAILLNGGTNVTILNNLIGTDVTGTGALGNAEGVSITSALGNAVSGVTVAGNTIAATTGSGINVAGAMQDLVIQANRIGVQANGTGPLPNGRGISFNNATGVTIGGSPDQGNEIANSTFEGINIVGASSGEISILSNKIHHNGGSGIRLGGNTDQIRTGDALGDGNEVYANGGAGLHIDGSSNGVIEGNLFHDNANAGVLLTGASNGNTIGGEVSATGNLIFNNGAAGIAAAGGNGNRFSRNSISGNTGLAIDLGNDGATPNDAGDFDTGPNGLQNVPVLTGVAITPSGSTVVLGALQSAANTVYRLEFFSGANGAAQTFLFATDVTTTADESAPFQFDLGVIPAGYTVVATATNVLTGETSELRTTAAAPAVPTLSISDVAVTETDAGSVDAVFTVTLSAIPTLPVTFNFGPQNGSAKVLADFADFGGTFTFPAGATNLTMTITVPVSGDDLAEPAENFFVKLSDSQNVLVLDDTGEGTILNDDSTLVIDPKGKIATWTDIDGDLVTLKASKGILSPDDFVFLADGNGGEQLAALLLGDDGTSAAKANLILTAKRATQAPLGNGLVNLGFLDATGIDLGKVAITGDLGRIAAGDSELKTPGIKSLTAGSMGFFGLGTQTVGGNLISEIKGTVGQIKLRGDFIEARLHVAGSVGKATIGGSLSAGADDFSGTFLVDGKLGSITVGGSVTGSAGLSTGRIESGASMGKVLVKGSVSAGAQIASGETLGKVSIGGDLAGAEGVRSATISAARNIAGVTVGGSVSFAQLLAGYSSNLVPVNPDASIGAVRVTDNWIASDLIAGVAAGDDGQFGTGDDAPATPVAPYADNQKILSRIASIQIGGYVTGTSTTGGDMFAFTAQNIGKLSVGALKYVLNAKEADALQLGPSKDVALVEVG